VTPAPSWLPRARLPANRRADRLADDDYGSGSPVGARVGWPHGGGEEGGGEGSGASDVESDEGLPCTDLARAESDHDTELPEPVPGSADGGDGPVGFSRSARADCLRPFAAPLGSRADAATAWGSAPLLGAETDEANALLAVIGGSAPSGAQPARDPARVRNGGIGGGASAAALGPPPPRVVENDALELADCLVVAAAKAVDRAAQPRLAAMLELLAAEKLVGHGFSHWQLGA